MRVEVVQKFSVGEMLEARGVVRHDVCLPIDEGDLRAVTMEPLV